MSEHDSLFKDVKAHAIPFSVNETDGRAPNKVRCRRDTQNANVGATGTASTMSTTPALATSSPTTTSHTVQIQTSGTGTTGTSAAS